MSNFFMRSVFHGMKETEKGKFRRCLRRRYQVHLADPPTTLNLVMTSTKRKLEASLDGLADNLPSLVCFLYKVHDLFAITFFPSSSRSFHIPFIACALQSFIPHITMVSLTRRLLASAFIALSAIVPTVHPLNTGFPYETQKIRGVNLGGWLVLEASVPSHIVMTGSIMTHFSAMAQAFPI